MIKRGLTDIISTRMGIKHDDANKFLNILTQAILENIGSQKEINLGSLGKLKVVERPAYKGRNPQTGKEMDIPACKIVKLVAGKALREAVNK